MREPILKFDEVYKSYGDGSWIIRGLTTEVFRGERILVTGKKDTGKSTLLALIATLSTPTVGRIEFFGEDLSTMKPHADVRRNHFGLVLPQLPLLPNLSLEENIGLPIVPTRCSRAERSAWIANICERFNLAPYKHVFPKELSASQRFYALLARAFINNPDILIIDELKDFLEEPEIPAGLDYIVEQCDHDATTLILAQEPGPLPEGFDRAIKL